MAMTNLLEVDWTLIPTPEDDGGALHLEGKVLPSVGLASTAERIVDLSRLPGRTVVYVYPLTGKPDVPLPEGWDMIPGARGCTPQSCAFRDHFAELRALGADHLFGLSVQDTQYQAEAAERLHLPFELLSDADRRLSDELSLPVFTVGGSTLLKRLTMVLEDGKIVKVFYPVFPPDRSVSDVLNWLQHERPIA